MIGVVLQRSGVVLLIVQVDASVNLDGLGVAAPGALELQLRVAEALIRRVAEVDLVELAAVGDRALIP